MTLLESFYTRIRGSAEYIASESLLFILNKSRIARDAVEHQIDGLTNAGVFGLRYISQETGSETERPDISGFDDNNVEKVIIETKFWASLTNHQPVTYLQRMSEQGGVLVFVCPPLRKNSLFNEVSRAVALNYHDSVKFTDFQVVVKPNLKMVIVTWNELLSSVQVNLAQNSDIDTLSDVNQLAGLCSAVDRESFLPLTQADLSPSHARRVLSYFRIVDKVVDRLNGLIGLSTQGLKTTPQKWGYRRYAQVGSLTVAIDVNLEAWGTAGDTPFWIQISEGWEISPAIRRTSRMIESEFRMHDRKFENGLPYFPLYVECDKVEEAVINQVCETISKMLKLHEVAA